MEEIDGRLFESNDTKNLTINPQKPRSACNKNGN